MGSEFQMTEERSSRLLQGRNMYMPLQSTNQLRSCGALTLSPLSVGLPPALLPFTRC